MPARLIARLRRLEAEEVAGRARVEDPPPFDEEALRKLHALPNSEIYRRYRELMRAGHSRDQSSRTGATPRSEDLSHLPTCELVRLYQQEIRRGHEAARQRRLRRR
jgi:hypothetical protein